jgi:CRISPR system Cascade subunit CasE
MSLYLSRARLRQDGPVAALARLLVPEDGAARRAASHRLVWSLFADVPDRKRDFLWREEGPGRFMMLSSRQPVDPHGLFELDSKAFAPALTPGDRLQFTLRANPTISRCTASGHSARHDVVMDALHHVPAGHRAAERPGAAQTAGSAWLARQGEARGFTPNDVTVDGYDRVTIPRDGIAATLGVLDISGILTVRDPPLFLGSIGVGMGRARAFGYGMMMIRRAFPA